jgi:hypothetical protein
LARSLQAQIRDPLWTLTRQWQMGEFAGDDAGSPVQATMGIESKTLTGYRPGLSGSKVQAFNPALPLEVHVERETVTFRVRGAVQLGRYFERRVLASGVATPQSVIAAFRAAFPIGATDPEPALAGQGGLQLRALAAGRVVDGQALYLSAAVAAAGGAPSPPLPPQAADPAIASVLTQFIAFRRAAFSEPEGDAAWQPDALNYAFAVEAASTADTAVVLESDEFPGGHLDWYDFSFSIGKPASTSQAPTYDTLNVLPMHVTFRGMQEDRLWAFEDSVTDFGQLDTEPVDLARMLVMEFGLVYGADWFFVPIPSQVGSLQRVTALVVTDTFGFRTLIYPVEQMPVIGGQHPWSLFKISAADGTPSDFIVLAPTLGISDDATPLEDVLFLRDNMAALAWAVEQKLQGALDLPVDGYEQYLARLRLDPSAAPPVPVAGGEDIAYTILHAVPDSWIPMIPVLSASGELLLRRGTMDVPGPGGTVVQLKAHSSILQPGAPYYLTERVVTPVGVDVRKYLRRCRWTDGSTLVWMGRKTMPGRGPGWSGLKFDYLRSAAANKTAA